eukprot:4592664-Pyramimonas_sp.AAC.1
MSNLNCPKPCVYHMPANNCCEKNNCPKLVSRTIEIAVLMSRMSCRRFPSPSATTLRNLNCS